MRTAPFVDAASRVTAQHLLQSLVVSNTDPTFLHLLTMCGEKAQRLGRPQRREGWLPSRLCCHTRAKYCSWSDTWVVEVSSRARRGRLLPEWDDRDASGARCPYEHVSCPCGRALVHSTPRE